MRRSEPEPCSINAESVARWLDDQGRTESAAFVRHLGRQCQEANQREHYWSKQYAAVLERLERYEPPAPTLTPVSYKPAPEASD